MVKKLTLPDFSAPCQLLGGLSINLFMRDYWQKKPLLVRQAFTNFSAGITLEEIQKIAANRFTESRLVRKTLNDWSLTHGPIEKLPSIQDTKWTVLLQSINLQIEPAHKLLSHFRFLPDARLDDVMLSFATKGGGVGPHFDSYDVFLVQAHGERQWRISGQKDLRMIEGLALKILSHFTPEQEWVLAPGDMLYLPPMYCHEGIALNECMTYSVGFRAHTYQELGEGFLTYLADEMVWQGRYADPELKATQTPAKLEDRLIDKVQTALAKRQAAPEDLEIFLGEYLSEPKACVSFESPKKLYPRNQFDSAAGKMGLGFAMGTRMLYRKGLFFINGESFLVKSSDKTYLNFFADQQYLEQADFQKTSASLKETLYDWYCCGWITLVSDAQSN